MTGYIIERKTMQTVNRKESADDGEHSENNEQCQ